MPTAQIPTACTRAWRCSQPRAGTDTRFNDVVVVQGGHSVEVPPSLELASNLFHDDEPQEDGYVVSIRTRSNAIDYTGLAQLHTHRAHPLVRADNFLYVHDTVTFIAPFNARFETFRLPPSPSLFTTWPLPNSNVVAFGAGVLSRFGTNFDGDLAKPDAFPMEFGYQLNRTGRPPVLPLTAFGHVIKLGPRLPNGSTDIYRTGTPRRRFFYPAFGLYKYSLESSRAGDILHGENAALFGGQRWLPQERLGRDAQPHRVTFGSRPSCWASCALTTVDIPRGRPLLLPDCRRRRKTSQAAGGAVGMGGGDGGSSGAATALGMREGRATGSVPGPVPGPGIVDGSRGLAQEVRGEEEEATEEGAAEAVDGARRLTEKVRGAEAAAGTAFEVEIQGQDEL